MKHFFHTLLMRRGPAAGLLLMLLWLAGPGPAARAQAPVWQAATTISSPTHSKIYATAADADGNVYMAGYFRSTLTLGSFALTSAGSDDVFIAKWNSSSNRFVWAQRVGGADDEAVTAITVQGTDIYLVGSYASGSVGFGTTTLANVNPGATEVYVAKLVDAGSTSRFAWALRAGGPAYEAAKAVTVQGTNVYVAGSFNGVSTFGSTTLTSRGDFDGFVAKITDAGASAGFVWAQQAGGTGPDAATAVAANATNVYVAGTYSSATATVGSVVLSNSGIVGTGDVFVAKLADAGPTAGVVWAEHAGSYLHDDVAALAVSGNTLYLAGDFYGTTAAFGPFTLTNGGGYGSADIFITGLVDAGASCQYAWARQAGGPSNDYLNALVLSPTGLYVAGAFNGPRATFGTTTLATANANSSIPDVFVAKFATSANTNDFVWAQQAGGPNVDNALAIAIGGNTVYVGGWFTSFTANFSNLLLVNQTGSIISYLASLTDPTITGAARAKGNLISSLFPNPAHATATVQLPAVPGASTATLLLTDALGRTLRSATVALPAAGLRYELDLRGLLPGVYAVRISAGSTRATQRLVVE